MEKFAVITLPDDRHRIIRNHSILKHLPLKYADLCIKYLSVQVSAVILDNESKQELGYMLDVPGFFMEWDKLTSEFRMKQIMNIVKRLKELDVQLLSFPLVNEFLNENEIMLIQNKGIFLLDGYRIRLCSLLMAVKTIFSIVRKDLPSFELGIWGADTDVGAMWVESLAYDVNDMSIGGSDIRLLNTLASKVIKNTGLSCRVTNDLQTCIKDKHIVIFAENCSGNLSCRQPSFNIFSYKGSLYHDFSSSSSNIFCMQSGWLEFPQDLSIGRQISTWDELGIIDGLFSIISKVYRNDILTSRISLKQIDRIKALFGLYPISILGAMTIDKTMHFDRIRMDYYRSRRRNLIKSNNIP